MPQYRLFVHLEQSGPVNGVSINLRNREEAFLIAQQYDGPSELWDDCKRICTISRSDEGIWMISEKIS